MDLNTKNDSCQFNPTSVVKTLNRLGRKQTLNLVKKVCLKPVLCSKLSQVPPEMTGSSVQETVKDMLIESSGQSLTSVQIGSSRPHTSQNPDFPMRQVNHVNQDVFFHVATHAPSVAITGLPQKKGLSPVPVLRKIKHVNSVSCVDPCLFVQSVPTVVHDGPVGGRLQKFWQVWQRLGANPRAVSILKEGYSLPFRLRPPHQGSNHSEQLCQSGQKPFPQRGTDLSPRKVGSRASPGPVFSSLLQPAVFSTQTGKQVEAYFRSESVEQVPQNRHIQDGNSGNHPDLATKRGVGDLAGFQRHILSHPYSPPVEEVHEILPQQTSVPVHCPSLRVGHGSSRVHQDSQGGETYGSEQGYKNPPRLVTESPFEGNWSPSHPSSVVSLPRTGLAGQHQKVGVGSSTGLCLRQLPVRPVDGSGFANSRKMGKLASEAVVFKG